MRVSIDIECNGITNPTKVWVICCLDIDTGNLYTFRRPSDDQDVKEAFLAFSRNVHYWIGHNCIGYDFPNLHRLLSFSPPRLTSDVVCDTLIVSKLNDYSRKNHSLESYGEELQYPKVQWTDWSKYSEGMEERCASDTRLCHMVYQRLHRDYISHSCNVSAISTEQLIQADCLELSDNGFAFDRSKAVRLLSKVTEELEVLDAEITVSFPPRLRLVREVHPTLTKFGTLNRKDFRFTGADISEYNGGPFSRCVWVEFNPSSHKQLCDVLHTAGWNPTDKTKTHIDAIRNSNSGVKDLQRYGWRINEANLATLPRNAPEPARKLARRILLESRRRTLTEWLGLVTDDGRIHGTFQSIGAWTHRMSHQKPNMANIPNSQDTDGNTRLLGSEMRSLFIAPPGRLLVGVDADAIQLRVFAHYINDSELIEALISGKKEDKSDAHSLNQRILGSVCKTRAAAKRFLYALFLGAGLGKLSTILGCGQEQAKEALGKLMERYSGFDQLKRSTIPRDARNGWFIGLDGRRVGIPGADFSERRHLAMSGYLQNGEAIIMKLARLLWKEQIRLLFPEEYAIKLVNFVHDEWQTEVPNTDYYIAHEVARIQCEAIRKVGEQLKLNCPLAGTYGDNPNDYKTWTFGHNWKETH